jgi:hypothetical protein
MDNRKLDYETCLASASKCKTRSEFKRLDRKAYRKACKMGWIETLIPNTAFKTLDYDTCYNIAKQCKTRTEFFKMDHAAYYKAMRSGWLDKWIPEYHWRKTAITFEKCKAVVDELLASGCRKRIDFKQAEPQMYRIAVRENWLGKLGLQDALTTRRQEIERRRIYTEEVIVNTAKQCPTLKYFRENYPGMYYVVSRKHWHDKIAFLEQSNGYKNGLLYDTVYVYEFPKTNVAYIGRTIDLNRRHYDHCHNDNDSIVQYAKSIGASIPEPRILATFAIRTKADKHGEMECKMIALYRSLGWTLLNKMKGGSMGSIGFGKWTLSKMIDAAKPFEYWGDFAKVYPGLYSSICSKHLRGKFPWLKLKKTTNGFWSTMNKDEAYSYASKCSSRRNFDDTYRTLYMHCCKRGWVDEWFPDNLSAKKRVCQYTLNGILIATYNSINEAARAVGTLSSGICDCLAGRRRTLKNSVWVYDTTPKSDIVFPGDDYRSKSRPKRAVCQYTVDGTLINSYESIKDAAGAAGIAPANISSVLRGDAITAAGFVWAYSTTDVSDVHFPGKQYRSPSSKQAIVQYTLNGNVIKHFDSVNEAARLCSISVSGIRNVLNGKNHTAGGSVWAYATTKQADISFPGINYKPKNTKRKLTQLTLDGKVIKIHNSIKSAADSLGISPASIHEVLTGRNTKAGGYKWEYADAQ